MGNRLVLLMLLVAWPLQANSAELLLAVASNFRAVMHELVAEFTKTESHKIRLSFASSGKHYLQIINGAPFDIFFSADSQRPALLIEQGQVPVGGAITYAIGRLALWSPRKDALDDKGNFVLNSNVKTLAIANPKLAPYGRAAQQVLAHGLLSEPRMVIGENIAQTFQFVASGNADLGFVAYSQVGQRAQSGSFWLVPNPLHDPILQQAVIIRDSPLAQQFIDFIVSDKGQNIIQHHGYNIEVK